MNRSAAILVLAAVMMTYAVGLATRPAESSTAMKPFVVIFRLPPTPLSGVDLNRRDLSTILFLEARDMADAVSVARSHPALRYGSVSFEVRPLSSPVDPVEASR